jgi:hypothetical protein
MMTSKWKQKLQHPVALTAQGFVFGVVLFWAMAPSESGAQATASTSTAAIHTSR